MKTRQMLVVVVASIFALLACSLGGGTTTVTTTSGATSTPGGTSTDGSTTTSPTNTPVPATNCAQALPGSAPAAQPGGPSFSDVPVPSNTFATALTPFSSGTGLWSIYLVEVCSQGIAVSSVRDFFAAQLPGAGWTQTPKLPLDGGYQAPCGNAYCWAKDGAPRYVGLENVTDHGNNVTTYQLRLFLPPPVPSCPSFFSTSPIHGYQSFVQVFTLYVPLPPLSLLTPDDASGGQKGLEMCSAGTASSVASFMRNELGKEGWVLSSSASSSDQVWHDHSGNTFHWSVPSATGWELDYRVALP